MDQIIAGAILTVILLIGVDVALNIKDRITRNIARKRMEHMLTKGLSEIGDVLKAEIEKMEAQPKVEVSAEEVRKAKNRTKMAAYRAKKRAAKKTK